MMGKTTLIVCLLFVLMQKAASDLLINASTSKINLETRSPLDINCTFSLNTHPEMAVLISLVLSRANATGHSFQDLASITQFTPDTVTVLTEEKFTATGVHSQTGESFLHVSWEHPTCLQGGIYQCSALGVNMIGRYVALTNTSSVIVDQANLKDIFEKLKLMKTRDSSMEDTITSMENQIQGLEYTGASTEHDIQIMKNHTTSTDNQIDTLQNDTTQMKNQIETLQKDATQTENQIQILENQTASMNSQMQTLQNDTTSLENQIESLKHDTASMENQIQTLENDTASMENQIQTLENDTASMENQIQTLENDTASMENQIQTLENDTASMENQIQTLENYTASMENQIQTLENNTASMENQIESLQNGKTFTENQIQILQKDKKSMEDGIKTLEKEKTAMAQNILNLEETISRLEMSMTQNTQNFKKTISDLESTVRMVKKGANWYSLGKYKDHYYYMSRENYSDVDQAKSDCKSLGGYLAVVNNRDEYTAIKVFLGYTSGVVYVVIDGSDEDREGKWILSDSNASLPYTTWTSFAERLNNRTWNCLGLDSRYSWLMNAVKCKGGPWDEFRYMCELSNL